MKIKISVIINISVFQFYEYIEDISIDILINNIGWSKIDQNL